HAAVHLFPYTTLFRSMGVVLQGRHCALGIEVAIKVILEANPELELIARFEREARTLAALDHPNIVKVIDYGQADGLPYFVMPLIDRKSTRLNSSHVKT